MGSHWSYRCNAESDIGELCAFASGKHLETRYNKKRVLVLKRIGVTFTAGLLGFGFRPRRNWPGLFL